MNKQYDKLNVNNDISYCDENFSNENKNQISSSIQNANSMFIKKEADCMSFVGLFNLKNHIIAVADSKATMVMNNGTLFEDNKRTPLQKVFKNDKFIFVTYGNNELFGLKNRESIETYTFREMKEKNWTEFFTELFERCLNDMPEYNDGRYFFMVGSKDSFGTYLINVKITLHDPCQLTFESKSYDFDYRYGGNKNYVEIMDRLQIGKLKDSQVIKNTIIKTLTTLIDIYSLTQEYDTVGLPIIIDDFI